MAIDAARCPLFVTPYSLFAIHPRPIRRPDAAARDGTRGEGAPAWRLHCKVAPHRRSHTASEGLQSTLFQPPGRSGRSAGGVGEETPGTGGSVSRRASRSLAGPDRRGRRSLPTRPRRSRQRPLGGRDGGSISEPQRGWMKPREIFSGRGERVDFAWNRVRRVSSVINSPDAAAAPSGLRLLTSTRI